jgi:hypothetical protein
MKHTWADPKEGWDGFRLTSYSLDSQKTLGLQLKEKRSIDGNQEEVATTVGEVYRRLLDQFTQIIDNGTSIEVTTDTEKLSFRGASFSCSMLTELLRIRKDGFDPFFAEWFFYADDSSREGPHELYGFFVVYIDKIIRERVFFSDYDGSGFDPSIFQADDNSPRAWVNDGATREARTHFWFQKFYSETQTGQIMALRQDKPRLYGRESNPVPPPQVSGNMLKFLDKIHGLLWVLIVLVALVLIRLWR